MTSTIFDIKTVEKKYNATFVGDFPIKTPQGWGSAGAVFYQANPDTSLGHKHLFGLHYNPFTQQAVIYDASYLDGMKFTGAMLDDGMYAWSRDRHDYRQVPGGALDGGFDYTRVIGNPKLATLQIKDGKVVEVRDNEV